MLKVSVLVSAIGAVLFATACTPSEEADVDETASSPTPDMVEPEPEPKNITLASNGDTLSPDAWTKTGNGELTSDTTGLLMTDVDGEAYGKYRLRVPLEAGIFELSVSATLSAPSGETDLVSLRVFTRDNAISHDVNILPATGEVLLRDADDPAVESTVLDFTDDVASIELTFNCCDSAEEVIVEVFPGAGTEGIRYDASGEGTVTLTSLEVNALAIP